MPRVVPALPPVEFAALLERFTPARRITSLHLHHLPAPEDPDPAVHAIVDADGTIRVGRHWDLPPRSAAGHNGTPDAGPFAIAVAGDFDSRRLAGIQRAALEAAIGSVRRRFGLPARAVVAHRRLEPTRCPGRHVDGRVLAHGATHPDAARPAPPFPDHVRVFHLALQALERERPVRSAETVAPDGSCGAAPGSMPQFATPIPRPVEIPHLSGAAGFRRVALCVGIDAYADAPLAGCVADARRWADTLTALGFTPHFLLDREATRAAILDRLEALVVSATPGDVVVFMFAGHGTQVPDEDGDERDRKDEALCPVDYGDGRLLIDDDLAPVMDRVPPRVNLTCFIDCCHSGTSTRLALDAPDDERVRRLVLPPSVVAAHRRFRAGRRKPPRRARPEVLFAACRPGELAWETGGHGDFTRKATARLRDAALIATNEEFNDQVAAAFGPAPRQHPTLTCTASAKRRRLLAPIVSGAAAAF
ncbi:MAG TPA: caspase family protein [Vicinamibacterales bacterium]